MKRTLAVLLLLATAPAIAARYPIPPQAQPLADFCMAEGDLAAIIAGYRDDGFKPQAVLAVIDQYAPKAKNPRYIADAKAMVPLIYYAGWSMSDPQQIGQGAYENCLAQHGSETWWREPTVASQP